uniref:Uncharacterized protein n=1 Tax=viral metagenome TaxID=1070528 RepID=A0A6C0J7M9_9ZZZZ
MQSETFFNEASANLTPVRYSLGEFYSLNPGTVKHPISLTNLISTYKMPSCCLKEPYINKLNTEFNQACNEQQPVRSARIMRIAAHEKHGDDRILSDIKKAFSSVTTGKDGTILTAAQIGQMNIPDNQIGAIVKLFFDTIIQIPNMIKQYLKVLFTIQRLDKIENAIRIKFCKMAIDIFEHPLVLEDTMIIDGVTRTRQHRNTTCLLFAHLYSYPFNDKNPGLIGPKKRFSNESKLTDTLLNTLIFEINDETQSKDIRYASMKCLTDSLGVITESGKYPNLLQTLYPKLSAIYKNKDFKLGKRLLLKEFIKE